MLAGAGLVAGSVHVAVALGEVVQDNQVQVNLLLAVPEAKVTN